MTNPEKRTGFEFTVYNTTKPPSQVAAEICQRTGTPVTEETIQQTVNIISDIEEHARITQFVPLLAEREVRRTNMNASPTESYTNNDTN